MKFLNNIISKIDQLLFDQITNLKGSSAYSSLSDALSKLDDDIRYIVTQTMTYTLLIIPFVAVATWYFVNHNTKKELQMREEVYSYAKGIINYEKDLMKSAAGFLDLRPIKSKADMQTRLRGALSSAKIDPTAITIKEVEESNDTKGISLAKVYLTITKGIALKQLTDFMRFMIGNSKMRLMDIEIIKDKDKMLKGSMSFFHAAKGSLDESK